jgi:hypothetical protein
MLGADVWPQGLVMSCELYLFELCLYELDFVAVALCVGSLSFANTLAPKTTCD